MTNEEQTNNIPNAESMVERVVDEEAEGAYIAYDNGQIDEDHAIALVGEEEWNRVKRLHEGRETND